MPDFSPPVARAVKTLVEQHACCYTYWDFCNMIACGSGEVRGLMSASLNNFEPTRHLRDSWLTSGAVQAHMIHRRAQSLIVTRHTVQLLGRSQARCHRRSGTKFYPSSEGLVGPTRSLCSVGLCWMVVKAHQGLLRQPLH